MRIETIATSKDVNDKAFTISLIASAIILYERQFDYSIDDSYQFLEILKAVTVIF